MGWLLVENIITYIQYVHNIYMYILYIMPEKSVFESAPRALQIAGFLILLACSGDMTQNKLIGVLIGYGFILVGMLVFTTLLFQNAKVSPDASGVKSVGPFVVFMILIVMLISIISKHFNKIAQGHVSKSFSNMMNLKHMLVMLILVISSMATKTDGFKATGAIGDEYGAAMYFMNILSSVILVTIYIVLSLYPTDGFVSTMDEL